MRMTSIVIGVIVAMAGTVGGASAFNGGSSIGGGTPDAQNGAQGRNNPTSYRGRAFVPAGDSDGYGYAAPRTGYYVPTYGYGYVRQAPYPYGR